MLPQDFKDLKPGVKLVFIGGKPFEGRYFYRGETYVVDEADPGVIACMGSKDVVAIYDKDGIKRYFLYSTAAMNFCSEDERLQETQKAKSGVETERRRYEIAKEVSTFFLQ